MRRPQAEIQKNYRDRRRGKPPRPYRTKPIVENTQKISVQAIVNRAFQLQTTTWSETTPQGRIQIKVHRAHLPTWLEINGTRFELYCWNACGNRNAGPIHRWAVISGRKRCTKVYLLDGRVGVKQELGLIHRSQQQNKKNRLLTKRHKLTERLVGKRVNMEWLKHNPDFIPPMPNNKFMRRKVYYRLRTKLLNPDRNAIRKEMEEAVRGLAIFRRGK